METVHTNKMSETKIIVRKGVAFYKELSILEYSINSIGISNTSECVMAVIQILEDIENYQATNLLINSRFNRQLFNKSLEGWLKNVIFHHIKRANIQNIAIVAEDTILRSRNTMFHTESEIRQVFFDSYIVALLWLTAKNKIKNR